MDLHQLGNFIGYLKSHLYVLYFLPKFLSLIFEYHNERETGVLSDASKLLEIHYQYFRLSK